MDNWLPLDVEFEFYKSSNCVFTDHTIIWNNGNKQFMELLLSIRSYLSEIQTKIDKQKHCELFE